MYRLITLTKVIAAILVIGTPGSIELDRIDLWTGICQCLLGITLLLLVNYWNEDVKDLENEKTR